MSRLYGDDEELTDTDASVVKGMIDRGDKNETIAAFFGVNQRAVSHIRSGKKFPSATSAKSESLPPPGPYGIDPIYIRFYQTVARVNALWERREMAQAKGLLEAALHNPVFVERLNDVDEIANDLFRDEFGLLKDHLR